MRDRRRSRRIHRLRAQALWAFLVAGVGLGATLVGAVQYLASGRVSVRPGHSPLDGSDALELLGVLFLVSSLFAICGFVFRAHAKRRDAA